MLIPDLLRCTLVIAAFCFVVPTALGQAWSDPATWPSGSVPEEGEAVAIAPGTTVVLDVSPPALASVIIGGTLRFDPSRDASAEPLVLTARSVMVQMGGTLEIGTESAPYTARAEIVLTGRPEDDPADDGSGMGAKVLGVMGTLHLHGQPRTEWTRLAQPAAAGATQIILAESTDWQPGDDIALASTDFDHAQAERHRVQSISDDGRTVTLSAPLLYAKEGRVHDYADQFASDAPFPTSVDQRGEIAHLTRSIVVRGSDEGAEEGYGGHLMAMGGATVRIHHTAFVRMGQAGRLSRYPIHFHQMGDAPDVLVRGTVVADSFQRCYVVHGTRGVTLERNVAVDAVGHCFFLEDGDETGNVLRENLAFGITQPSESDALLSSDLGFPGSAAFWVTNPANDLVGNVAAGGAGAGFWLAFPERPTGLAADRPESDAIRPLATPLGRFEGNVAHSNTSDGFHLDNGVSSNGEPSPLPFRPLADPLDAASAPVEAVFSDLIAYKNRSRGLWTRGDDHRVEGSVFADNRIGLTFAVRRGYVERSLFVGETPNVGTPQHWEPTGADGRTVPAPWDADFPIRGFEYYDGLVAARQSGFAAFMPSDLRPASALGVTRFTDFEMHPGNYAEALAFAADGTQRFYREALASDGSGGVSLIGGDADGYRSIVVNDLDGTLTGEAGGVLVPEGAFFGDGCEARDGWNAQVCAGTYRTLYVRNRQDEPEAIGPLEVTRADEPGAPHVLGGVPEGYYGGERSPSLVFQTGTQIEQTVVLSAEVWPSHLQVRLDDGEPGEWITVRLAGWFETWQIASVYAYRDWWVDHRNAFRSVGSANALAATDGAHFFRDADDLLLKLQVRPDLDYAAVEVCPRALCAAIVTSDETAEAAPEAFALAAPFPNPTAREATTIVHLAEIVPVRVAAYDALGRAIATLHDGVLPAGAHPLRLDAGVLAPGVYLVRATSPHGAATQRLIVAR